VAKAQWEGSVCRKHIVYRNAGRLPDRVFCPATARRNRNNRQTSRQLMKNISVEAVVSHSPQHELPYVFEKTKRTPEAESKQIEVLRFRYASAD
jgi:hypothetical protein